MSRRTTTLAAATVAAALALPAAADAHVTVNPRTAVAGAYTELQIRVPDEQDDASTTKVQLQLPDGFAQASYEPRPGWSVTVTREKLATPVQTDDGPVTEEVKEITWTGEGGADGEIGPGQFVDFPLSVQIPENAAGKALTFKALQTYSNGDVVRWIGAPDSEHPAPTLQVSAAGASTTASAATPPPAAPATSDDRGGTDTVSVIALVVGVLALLAAGAAVLIARRPRAA